MKSRLFDSEERAIVRSLGLLSRASQQLIKSGVADEIYPRLRYCISAYAADLRLQLIAPDSTTEDIDASETASATEVDVHDGKARLADGWPTDGAGLSWMGFRTSKRLVPTLDLTFPYDVAGLFRPDGISLSIDYGEFSRALKSRPKAQQRAEEYDLLPSHQLWYEGDVFLGVGKRKITRFDSPWYFHARSTLSAFPWIDATALLRGRKPPPLTHVAPRIATLLQEYSRLCSKFEEMQAQEGALRKRRGAKTLTPRTDFPTRNEPDDETRFLREHATEILQASQMYAEGFWLLEPSLTDVKVASAQHVVTERDPVRNRLVEFLRDAVAKKCDVSMKSFDRPHIQGDPNLIVPRGTAVEMIRGNKCWGKAKGNIRLAVRLVVPDGVETDSFELLVAVYLNPLLKGRSTAALRAAHKIWSETGAECFAEWAVQWNPTRPRTTGKFWGYTIVEPVAVDMERLAEEDDSAISGLDAVIKVFLSASKKVEQSLA